MGGASIHGGDQHSVITACAVFGAVFAVLSALSVSILAAVNWRPWRIYRWVPNSVFFFFTSFRVGFLLLCILVKSATCCTWGKKNNRRESYFLGRVSTFRSAPVEVGLGRTERKEIKHGDSAYSAAQGAGRSSLDIDVTAMMHIPCGGDHLLEN